MKTGYRILDEAYKVGLLRDFGDYAVVEMFNPLAVHGLFDSRKRAYAKINANYWQGFGVEGPLMVRDMATPFLWHDPQHIISHAVVTAYGDIDKAVAVMEKRVREASNFDGEAGKAGERSAVLRHALGVLQAIQIL